MKISVSCASGTEAVVKREMVKLGYGEYPSINGSITFEGDFSDVARLNLYLRSASRVYIVLCEGKVTDFDSLYDLAFGVDYKQYFPVDGKFIIEAKCVLSAIHAVSVTQSIVKKAVCNKLFSQYGVTTLNETGERYRIEVAIFKDYCRILLNTSGEGLHRRGYRKLVGDAPLKENVASALIELSVWNLSRPFCDLFCGSGTIPIEAGLIAKNIPSGYFRDFDFLHWKNFSRKDFDLLKEEATDNVNRNSEVYICGFDIDDKALKLARQHAKNAGVDDIVHFQRQDMRDFKTHKQRGVIISNPPYGERLNNRKEIETLYKDYGKIRERYPDWCYYTLTPVDDFERLFGFKCDKKRKIYNANIECFYYHHLAPKPTKR